MQQRVRAAVERGGRDDVVASAAQREDGGHLRGLAGRGRERRAAALDRRHALLEHRHRRVGDARVDVAEGLQVEEARGVVGRVEHERGRLVDRRGARAGRGVGDLPGVQAQRLDAELAVCHRSDSIASTRGVTVTRTARLCVPPPRITPRIGVTSPKSRPQPSVDVRVVDDAVVRRIEVDPAGAAPHQTDAHACEASAPTRRGRPGGGEVSR